MEQETKEILGIILNKLDDIVQRLDRVEQRLDKVEQRLDNLEQRMDHLEARQDEIFIVVKAIEHNNQVHRAEIDSLKHTAGNLEGTINAIGDVITKRKAM